MPSIFDRLKKRKLVQWALAYVAGAWLLLEVLQYLSEMFGWPGFVGRSATVLAGVGLLAVLVLAWYHGEKGRQRVGGLELLLLAGLLLLGGVAVSLLGGERPAEAADTGLWSVASLTPEAIERRLAVLPLANLSADPTADEYLVDGLHEEIRSQVAKIRGLDVPARTSLMRFKKRPDRDVAEIAAELGVRHVLDGSVRRAANRVRVSVQLIDASTGNERWGQSYDREFSAAALFDIQSDVALQIARALEVQLSLAERTSIEQRGTDNDQAYETYLRGLYEWLKYAPPYLQNANALFREAVELDPEFAKAWSGLGGSYVGMGNMWVMRPEEAFPPAKAAAQRALELDPDLAQAHVMLAWAYFTYEHDWQETDRLVRRALELSPGEQEPHYLRAYWLQAMGRFEEAVAEGRTLLELDPLSAPMYSTAGRILYFARRYEEAIETLRRGIALDPTDAALRYYLGLALAELGRHDEAVSAIQELLRLAELGDPAELAAAYEAEGMHGVWRWWLEFSLGTDRAGSIAAAYALLGDRDAAFEWLERAYAARDSWLFQLNDPVWDSLRDDPRFSALIRRLDLPVARIPQAASGASSDG